MRRAWSGSRTKPSLHASMTGAHTETGGDALVAVSDAAEQDSVGACAPHGETHSRAVAASVPAGGRCDPGIGAHSGNDLFDISLKTGSDAGTSGASDAPIGARVCAPHAHRPAGCTYATRWGVATPAIPAGPIEIGAGRRRRDRPAPAHAGGARDLPVTVPRRPPTAGTIAKPEGGACRKRRTERDAPRSISPLTVIAIISSAARRYLPGPRTRPSRHRQMLDGR